MTNLTRDEVVELIANHTGYTRENRNGDIIAKNTAGQIYDALVAAGVIQQTPAANLGTGLCRAHVFDKRGARLEQSDIDRAISLMHKPTPADSHNCVLKEHDDEHKGIA